MNFPNSNKNPYGSQHPLSNGGSPFDSSTLDTPVIDLATEFRLEFIRKTYSVFMLGILVALLAGWATLNVPPVMNAAQALRGNLLISIGLLFGLSIGAQAVSRVPVLNLVAMFAFTAFMGFFLTPLLAMYNSAFPGIVTQAAVLTTLTFSALTAYAFISKKDFSFMGGLLFVGMIALILGGLANVFLFKSSMASYLMAWVSLLIFSGFVLYETSNIMRTHDAKSYVSAALVLFISFVNMFLAILRILAGGRRD
jgi:modulator of FtsH protease